MAQLLYIDPCTGHDVCSYEDEYRALAHRNGDEAEHWKNVARTLAEFVLNENECTEQYAKMVIRASRNSKR